MKSKQRIQNIHHKKRYGEHQKRSKRFANTYLPYLPMTIILFLSVLFSGYTPHRGTLAYATDVSYNGLLAATNNERINAGSKTLKLNDTLNKAAQAKANDMTSRNYWSHNTPDGKEPWYFINNAGYSYLKAGENLAYGFTTSGDTVKGWMNSKTHRENLLDPAFADVGFGFANSNSYNNSGQETVVVAMYGNPMTTTTETQNNVQGTQETPIPTNIIPQPPQSTEKVNTVSASVKNSKPISRIESLTGGSAPWALLLISFVTGIGVTILLMRHSLRLRHLLKNSEKFVLHHPVIDTTLVALIILGLTLTRTVGFIR